MEVTQKISDPRLTHCPACGKEELQRLVSHSSFALKGGGWYADGYGDGKKPAPEASGTTSKKAPEAKTESSDTAKTAELPAKPAESKPAKASSES
jgi:putative FmdB family regulatory protein